LDENVGWALFLAIDAPPTPRVIDFKFKEVFCCLHCHGPPSMIARLCQQ
jgi:hypothetical protein